jgi:hypothetical protein
MDSSTAAGFKTALGRDVEIHLILRSGASRFAQELHRLLGIPVIMTDARVEATIVHISWTRVDTRVEGRVVHRGGANATDGLLPEIFDGFQNGAGTAGTPEKIYVSGKVSRTVSNEPEITDLLESRGFQKVSFEDIPVSEQWRVFGNAREIVSIHGAAMAFLVCCLCHGAFRGTGRSPCVPRTREAAMRCHLGPQPV